MLPGLEQRLHESIYTYYMDERYYLVGVLLFCIFVKGQLGDKRPPGVLDLFSLHGQ